MLMKINLQAGWPAGLRYYTDPPEEIKKQSKKVAVLGEKSSAEQQSG